MQSIADWLESNTFHHSQFADINRLVAEKNRQNLSISLCIPTLNEESTIGEVVSVLRSELQERYRLLDEIAVVDSGSTDQTRASASHHGADVYQAAEILPDMGCRCGKGENLWKSVYQIKGDVLVFVDGDIRNIHPRFVYGLVAPLLFNPVINYVKAFYDRPLVQPFDVWPSGGGRVTEILIRPLFSLFFPELTAIVQPLSGEYAVRREVLERIPFPVGYGVETAHLIDVYSGWGLKGFAQTDLDEKVHRHQSTRDLGKMSFGILQIFMKRLKEKGLCNHLPDLTTHLRQFVTFDKEYRQVVHDIDEQERPPMIEVAAYLEKYTVPS